MKTLTIICITLCFFMGSADSQTRFQKLYGKWPGDSCCSGVTTGLMTNDGGYLLSGWTNLNSSPNWTFLVKTDAAGSLQWSNIIRGMIAITDDIQPNDMIRTSEGGYAQVGYEGGWGAGNEDIYFVKLDVAGNIISTRAYGFAGDDIGYSIKQTHDSGFIMTGYSSSPTVAADVIALRTDADGNLMWSRTYGSANTDYVDIGRSVVETPDGGFLIGGSTYSPALEPAMYFIRTNAIGDTLWTKMWYPSVGEGVYDMRLTPDSGFIILSATTWPNGAIMVMRTDSALDTLWVKQYVQAGFSHVPARINRTVDGGYIISGSTYVGSSSAHDAMVIKIDSAGNYQWSRAYGNPGNTGEVALNAEQAADGGFFIGGDRDDYMSPGYIRHFYLVKTDAQGESGCFESGLEILTESYLLTKRNTQTRVHLYNPTVSNPTPADVATAGFEYNFCTSTVDIQENYLLSQVYIYPNPVTNHFTIRPQIKNSRIEINNVLGVKVYSEKLTSESIYLNQPAGIYFVKVSDGERVWTQKLVIE